MPHVYIRHNIAQSAIQPIIKQINKYCVAKVFRILGIGQLHMALDGYPMSF